MVLRTMIIYGGLLTFLHSFVLASTESKYYACPAQSICVHPNLCPTENVTYNAYHPPENPPHKYVCGVFPEAEGFICCNEPIDVPSTFVPTLAKWWYSEETSEDVSGEEYSVPVYPYPGLELTTKTSSSSSSSSSDDEPNDLECPPSSVCVGAFKCLPGVITFLSGFSNGNYTCGLAETAGRLCCLEIGIISTAQDIKSKLQELFSRKKRDFTETDFDLASAVLPSGKENLFAKREKIYTEMAGRSSSEDVWECGRSLSISRELQRIYSPIGDRIAEEGHYPWHVAILSSSYEYLCSGVIVGEKLVITIAHCFDKNDLASNLLVRVGDLNLKLESEKNPAFDVRVNLLVIHPDYDKVKLNADIAVLELEQSVRGIQHIRPACLPFSKYHPTINRCKVPGWGQYTKSKEPKTDEFSYELRDSSFYIIEKRQCQNELRRAKELGPFFKLQKDVLCAKGFSNADTCTGDGGSGLVCRDKDIFVLKGLVSYGVACGFNLPGVYTNVESYLDFIQNYKSHSAHENSKDNTINKDTYNPSRNGRVDAPKRNYGVILDNSNNDPYYGGSPVYLPDDPYYGGSPVEYSPDDPYYGGSPVEYSPDDPYYGGSPVEYLPDDPYYEGSPVEYLPDDPYYEGSPVEYLPDDPYYEGSPVEYLPDDPYYEGSPVEYLPDDPYYEGSPVEYLPDDPYYGGSPVEYLPDDPYYEGSPVEYLPDDPYYEGSPVEYLPDDPYYGGSPVEYLPDDPYYEGPPVEYFPHDPYYDSYYKFPYEKYVPDISNEHSSEYLYEEPYIEPLPLDSTHHRAEYKPDHSLHIASKRDYIPNISKYGDPLEYEYNPEFDHNGQMPIDNYQRPDAIYSVVHRYDDFHEEKYKPDYKPHFEDTDGLVGYEETSEQKNDRLYYGNVPSTRRNKGKRTSPSRVTSKNFGTKRRNMPEMFSDTLATLSRYELSNASDIKSPLHKLKSH